MKAFGRNQTSQEAEKKMKSDNTVLDDLESGDVHQATAALNSQVPSTWPRSDETNETEEASEEDVSHREVRELTSQEIQAVRSGSKVVYIVLFLAAISLSVATYFFLSSAQQNKFESEFHSYAREAADIAENNAKSAFEQLSNLATDFTSYGLEYIETTGGFPNVTIPHFQIRAEQVVNYTNADMILYVPFVEEACKAGWENFINDQISRHLHYHDEHEVVQPGNSSDMEMQHVHRRLEATGTVQHEGTLGAPYSIKPCKGCLEIEDTRNGFLDVDLFMESVLTETVGTHTRNISKLSAPIAQYGPLVENNTLPLVMQDLFSHPIFKKEMTAALEYNVPVISEVLDVNFLLEHSKTMHTFKNSNAAMGHDDMGDHGGHHAEETSMKFDDKLRSFTLDAVKESFEDGARTVGFIVSILPWGIFFEKVLSVDRHHHSQEKEINGLVVEVVSDCGAIFTYVMNGGKADSMHSGDAAHFYKGFEEITHTSRFFWKDHPKGISRHCHFDIHLYPSEEFYSSYKSNEPAMYAGVIFALFAFTAILFSFYDRYIFKRQKRVISQATSLVIENARRAARNEREMNDFIAHEVRNPLAAAMSACSFVSSAIQEEEMKAKKRSSSRNMVLSKNETRETVKEDLQIIDSSLHFINDLLRNMLDMQRASSSQMSIEEKATHLMDDVFHPVSNMLHVAKGSNIKIELNTDGMDKDDLIVMTDPLRVKQILLNLSRNSVKFVERGFIRLRAKIIEDKSSTEKGGVVKRIELSVEDSGPGIPLEKRKQLFNKFQETLDSLNQGTGIGLNLCQKLSILMNAKLYIDESYDSGIPGCPGSRFVLDLQKPPYELDTEILESLSNHHTASRTDSCALSMSSHSGMGRSLGHQESSGSLASVSLDGIPDDAVDGEEYEQDLEPIEEQEVALPKNLRVLFTDDDMVLRKLFSRSLKKVAPDWDIKEASNGETAIRLAQEASSGSAPFDLIFMDQYMASVNKQLLGTETVRALRGVGVTAAICGLSANDVEPAFLEAGANAFMFKPFPCKPDMLKQELLRILANAAGSRGQQDELLLGQSARKTNTMSVSVRSSLHESAPSLDILASSGREGVFSSERDTSLRRSNSECSLGSKGARLDMTGSLDNV